MKKIGKILHPTDLSEHSRTAFRHACHLASRLDASLEIVRVILPKRSWPELPDPDSVEGGRVTEALQENCGLALRALAEKTDLPNDRVRTTVLFDIHAGPAIRKQAEESGADLIVMGTHGRRGIRRLLLGSGATETLHHAPCSVMVVPTLPEKAEAGIESILVPVDFSSATPPCLETVQELAAALGCQVELLHVIENAVFPSYYPPEIAAVVPADLDSLKAATEERLRELVPTADGVPLPWTVRAVAGNANDTILELGSALQNGLIILGSHGLRGAARILMGSTAEAVARRADIPVLAVRQPPS